MMKKKSTLKATRNVNNENIIQNKKSSIWKFLCPCFCSKKSQNQNNNKQKDITIRQQFYEQNTFNLDNIHEATEASLPMNFIESEFGTHNQKNQQESKQNQNKSQRDNKNNLKPNIVKFNIKRNSNLGGYLNQVKQLSIPLSGKQNNQPNNLNERYFPNKNEVRHSDDVNQDIKIKKGKSILEKLNNNKMKINRQQLISIEKQLQKMQGLADYQFLQNWQQSYENNYPINSLQQNKLMIIGTKTHKLLTKITSVKLFPSASSIERYKESIKNKKLSQKYGKKDIQFNSQLDRFWDKRYFLFQRFDEGIKLDQESWYSVTPEAVADYVSSKVNVKNTILDAFCGAGGDCLKLASSCANIIANDIDETKIKCLLHNAKIYDINNITISCSDFFKLNFKVDAVYLAPPWGGPDYYKIQSFHPDEFEPKLSAIIQKALTLSSNLFFLLPANTDVQQLASIISEKVSKLTNFIPQSCCLKIEKIYFNERLKFLLILFGNSQVQNDIKLGEQLAYIYDMLREDFSVVFKHKKLVRKIRQEYGMVKLLNFMFECQNYKKQGLAAQKGWTGEQRSMIDKFEMFLLDKKLIDEKTLQKIKQQQQLEYEYELKNKQLKNKKQKNKKIQKHKQKQQRQLSLNSQQRNPLEDKILLKQDCPQDQIESQNDQIPLSQIIKQANQHNQHRSPYKNDFKITVESNNQIQSISQDNEKYPARDSLRTVSMVSEFHQDQLRNIGNYQRLTTNSDISIKDSIQPIQKYDSLDISIDQSYRVSQQTGNEIIYSAQKKNQNQLNQQFTQRHSSPAVLSSRQNIKMKKVKIGTMWQKGIVQQANQQRQRDS